MLIIETEFLSGLTTQTYLPSSVMAIGLELEGPARIGASAAAARMYGRTTINKFISKYTYAILEADSRAPHNDGMHLPTYDLLNITATRNAATMITEVCAPALAPDITSSCSSGQPCHQFVSSARRSHPGRPK